MAKQTAQRGGIGVADAVEKEMLKLQGLTEPPGASAAAPAASASTPSAHVWPRAAAAPGETAQ